MIVPRIIIERIKSDVKNVSHNIDLFHSENLDNDTADNLIKEYLEISEYEFSFNFSRFLKIFITTFSHFWFGILTTIGIMIVDGYGF
jgi:hypothetical protein